ncbi:MAG: glutamyl-tRNA reductase [Bacteroidales bacterium]|nr:glutamyl-tRNA reductase [Bacteroidales bacterium]
MIGLIGISYKSADLIIRERFSFSKEEISELAQSCIQSGRMEGIVILSTCNRSEIYYSCSRENTQAAIDTILNELTVRKNYDATLAPHFYFKQNSEMVQHLFKVVSGIDSLIIGEDQIIGQVKEAYTYAENIKSTDKILRRLFLKAFEVGKKVRTETQISRGNASASSAAVNLAHQRFMNMKELHVMMIGAGQTGQLVLNSLRKSKFASLTIANRTFSKAEELAQIYGGTSITIDEINEHLPQCDMIFIATDAKEPIVKHEAVVKAVQRRGTGKKQSYFDLSVPRNIEDSIADIEGVELFTIDDLQNIVQNTTDSRMREVSAALKIIERAKKLFVEWEHEQELIPTIIKIKENFHKLNRQEMEEFYKNRSIEQSDLLEEYAQLLSDKFARTFIKNLKTISKDADSKTFVEMAEDFFELK